MQRPRPSHLPPKTLSTRRGPITTAAPRRRAARRQPVRTSRWYLLLAGLAVALVVAGFILARGGVGAMAADVLRATIGPAATAQIESDYLGISDTLHRAQYYAGAKRVQAPWKISSSATGRRVHPASAKSTAPHFMALSSIRPLIAGPLPGEGVWTTSGLPEGASNAPPIVAKTFVRPDPLRPYAIVTLLQFDLHHLQLHAVPGIQQPGGPVGVAGSGVIPSADQAPGVLVAAFNGGFKYADGAYGMMVDHTVYVPPQPGAATIAITDKHTVILGAWGRNPALNAANTHLVAWRQNGSLLIDHGRINPLTANGAAWGATVLNSVYTWRSAIGLTRQGTLLYAAGNDLSVVTLAHALRAAGATRAMELDINPFWVRAFTYGRDAAGQLSVTRLRSEMPGTGVEYLYGDVRDFFYITRR